MRFKESDFKDKVVLDCGCGKNPKLFSKNLNFFQFSFCFFQRNRFIIIFCFESRCETCLRS